MSVLSRILRSTLPMQASVISMSPQGYWRSQQRTAQGTHGARDRSRRFGTRGPNAGARHRTKYRHLSTGAAFSRQQRHTLIAGTLIARGYSRGEEYEA